MTDYDYADRPPLPSRGSVAAAFIGPIVALAIIAGIVGLLWTNRNILMNAAPANGNSSASVNLEQRREVEALRRDIAELKRSLDEVLEMQRLDTRRLADQNAALIAKVDALRLQPTSPTQNALPLQPLRQPPPAAAKRSQPARPSNGGVSIGGAPLPAAPEQR